MLIFKEGLESSPSSWTAAFQTKCQKLAEPTCPRDMTDRKEGGDVRIVDSACKVIFGKQTSESSLLLTTNFSH